jgi:hypothetical protein
MNPMTTPLPLRPLFTATALALMVALPSGGMDVTAQGKTFVWLVVTP